jgi:hypothetical protein
LGGGVVLLDQRGGSNHIALPSVRETVDQNDVLWHELGKDWNGVRWKIKQKPWSCNIAKPLQDRNRFP